MPPGSTSTDRESRDVDLRTLGVPVRLSCGGDDADALAAAVRRTWAAALAPATTRATTPATTPGPDPEAAVALDVVLAADDAVRAEAEAAGAVAGATVDDVLHLLSGRVTLAAIERQAGRLWMLHGAGLADPVTGAAVALVAPSGTGKSTAARTLGTALGYLTDETVGIDADLRLHPHPKPLSIVRPGTDVKDQVAPSDAGLLPAPDEAALRAIVLLRRDGTREVGLEPVRTSMALAALAPETSYLARLPRPLSFVAGIVAGTAGVFEAHYAEAEDLAPVVTELVAR